MRGRGLSGALVARAVCSCACLLDSARRHSLAVFSDALGNVIEHLNEFLTTDDVLRLTGVRKVLNDVGDGLFVMNT